MASLHRNHKPDSAGLSRSKSYGGLLAHQRNAFLNQDISGSTMSLTLGGKVLGKNSSAAARNKQNFSATWSGKPPKLPRPERTFTIFHAIIKGLKESIRVTEKDIVKLKQGIQDISNNSPQQLRAAERYLKRLEFQLLKIEELREKYEIHYKMRTGVQTMKTAYAYQGTTKDSSLHHNIQQGLRECKDVLCALETELEQRMGTFNFHISRLQGYSRLCPGDVYDITLKHGEQKLKSRVRVLKDCRQEWDCQQFAFKALLEEILFIKAMEIRSLSKSLLLGNKYCETKELFSAYPQLVTLVLNSSGSLKLNLIVTWNPFHGCLDDSSPRPLPAILSLFSTPTLTRHDTFTSPSECVRVRELKSPQGLRDSCLDGGWEVEAGLTEVLAALTSNLADLHRPKQLAALEAQITRLHTLLGVNLSRRGSADSTISLSVQSALGCFDFLEEASVEDDLTDENSSPKLPSHHSHKEGGGTADSGIASLAAQNGKESSPPASGPSTGWEQLDLTLLTHLLYCQRLLENVGLFGPLKFQEEASLKKLEAQAKVLERLSDLVRHFQEQGKTLPGVALLSQNEELTNLWSYISGGGEPLCLPARQLQTPLEHYIHGHNLDTSDRSAVAKLLLKRIQDSHGSATEDCVTVLQLELVLGSQPLLHSLQELSHLCKLTQVLTSTSIYDIKTTLNSLDQPSKEVLWLVGRMLIGPNPALTKLAETFLKRAANSNQISKMVSLSFLEGLESDDPDIRRGACRALAHLEDYDAIKPLAYVSYADESTKVQQEARNALFFYGNPGIQAYRQIQEAAGDFSTKSKGDVECQAEPIKL